MAFKLPNLRPVSIRFYYPELRALCEPGGRIVEYLAACFDGSIIVPDGSGRVLPAGYYWTACKEPVIHCYTIQGIVWDNYDDTWKGCCYAKEFTGGLNPCGDDCFTPSCPNPAKWWLYLPDPLPDPPIVLVSDDVEAALNDDDSAWWY